MFDDPLFETECTTAPDHPHHLTGGLVVPKTAYAAVGAIFAGAAAIAVLVPPLVARRVRRELSAHRAELQLDQRRAQMQGLIDDDLARKIAQGPPLRLVQKGQGREES